MLAKKETTRKYYPKLHYTKKGAVYANPKDIITSGSAQKQIKELKDSNLVKSIKSRRSRKKQ